MDVLFEESPTIAVVMMVRMEKMTRMETVIERIRRILKKDLCKME